MKVIDLQQAANYLESVHIEHSARMGANIVHIGISNEGKVFIFINLTDDRNVLVEVPL